MDKNCICHSNRLLTDIFLTLSNAEIMLENLRVELCLICDFTIHAAFNKIDKKRIGLISSFELLGFVSGFT
jgi:hypothetical protein